MSFALKMMDFAFKRWTLHYKMMKFAFKMMIFAFKMITFALQMMNCGGATKRVVGSLKMEFHWEKPSAFFAARCFYIEMKPSFNGEQKILSAEK